MRREVAGVEQALSEPSDYGAPPTWWFFLDVLRTADVFFPNHPRCGGASAARQRARPPGRRVLQGPSPRAAAFQELFEEAYHM